MPRSSQWSLRVRWSVRPIDGRMGRPAAGDLLSNHGSGAIAATLLALVKPSHATASLAPADFLPVFLAMSVFCLASIPFFAALPHDAGAEVSRARDRAPEPKAD